MSLRPPSSLPGLPVQLIEWLRGYYDELVTLVRLVADLQPRYQLVTFAAATTDVQVFHGLGAPVTAWEVVDRDTDSNVWQSATVNTNPALFIILQASAPVVVKLRLA